jgi:hypothetical protein
MEQGHLAALLPNCCTPFHTPFSIRIASKGFCSGSPQEEKKTCPGFSKRQLLRMPQVLSLFQIVRRQYKLTSRNLLRQDATGNGVPLSGKSPEELLLLMNILYIHHGSERAA